MDYYKTYARNRFAGENSFVSAKVDDGGLPNLETVKPLLPVPFWTGHDGAMDCYWKTWALAFRNLMKPAAGSGFVSNFIDTAFNGCLFEYVFGIRSDVPRSRIVWDVRLLEEHGIERYPFGGKGTVSLKCGRRASSNDKPVIEAHSDIPLILDIRWEGGREKLRVG